MAWPYYKAVEVSGTPGWIACGDSETAFTGSVWFSGDTQIGLHANPDGSDLRVSLDGGVTFVTYQQLQYYTVSGGAAEGLIFFSYNPATTDATLDVRVYYGNSSVSFNDSTAVWDANTKFVQSAVDITGAISPVDKSQFANTLSSNNATLTSGPIGKALSYTSPQLTEFATSSALDVTGPVSVSCFFNTASFSSNFGLVGKNANLTAGYELYCYSDSLYFFIGNGSFAFISASPPSTSAWHQIVGTSDNTNLNLYIDGASAATPVTPSGTLTSDSTPLDLGYEQRVRLSYTGLQAFVRIDGDARSADWIALDYAIINGWATGSITLGAEQSAGGGGFDPSASVWWDSPPQPVNIPLCPVAC